MNTYTFFKVPKLDARVGLAVEGGMLALVLLAEGCSRKGKEGSYTYTRRNPDRRKVAKYLFEHHRVDHFVGGTTVRAGKKTNLPEHRSDALAAFRKGGNYAFHLWGTLPSTRGQWTAAQVAEHFGLVPCENRPVSVTWPEEVA